MPNLKNVTHIEDLRVMAHRRVPRAFIGYLEAGSYEQSTLRLNIEDMERIRLRQRIMVDVDNRDMSGTILGKKVPIPLGFGPVAMTGLQHGNGEILACRAAQDAGLPFCLSTMSICSIEDVAGAVRKPFWFQLYVMRDRGFVRSLIDRAIAAKCSALVVTVDLQVLGQRHCDVKNGLSVPPQLRLNNFINMLTRPAWIASVLSGKRWTFGNLAGHVKGMENVKSLAEWTSKQFDPTLNWKDLEWIRERWNGPIILKGILDIDDAKNAVKTGADAIVVSNHGGRQLDGAASSIAMLPRIADAVGNDVEIMFDGGIRTGMDIMRALASGAQSCLIGRAYNYGIGAAGYDGAKKAIDILRSELDIAMALTGTKTLAGMGTEVLLDPPKITRRAAAKMTPKKASAKRKAK